MEEQNRYSLRTPRTGTPSRTPRTAASSRSPGSGTSSSATRTPVRDVGSVRKPAPRTTHRTAARRRPNSMSDGGGYIAGLDGLRALAVTAVIAYHVFPATFRGGFLGVDIFFVISGFLITTLLLREDRRNNYINLKQFWVRRARRLLPALLFLIVVVVPAAWLVSRDLLVGIGRQVLGAATFSTNWLEITHGSSYFDNTTPLLFKNFWSLAIEEQFYLIWPLVMLVVLAVLTTWWQRVILAGIIVAVSAGLMMLLYAGDNLTRVYYGTDTHIFGLAIGILVAFLWADRGETVLGSRIWRSYGAMTGWVALAMLVIFIFVMPDDGPWAYMGGMLLASIAAALIIAAMLIPGSIMAQIAELRAWRWIGTRSYGLYLWHWPVLVIVQAAWPLPIGSAANYLRSFLAVMLTCIIVELSFRFIETPIREYGFGGVFDRIRSAINSTAIAKILAAAMAALLVLTGVAIATAPAKSQTQIMIEEGENGGGEASASTADSAEGGEETVATPPARDGASGSGGASGSDDTSASGAANPAGSATTSPFALLGARIGLSGVNIVRALPIDFDTSIPQAEEVTVFGDSMIAASATGIEYAMPGVTLHGLSNMQYSNAFDMVNNELQAGTVGRAVVLDYGTNAGISDPNVVRQVINALGNHRMIFLVNLYSPSTFIDSSNELLAQVADEYANVTVIDWNSVAKENPSYLQVDMTHTSIEGANAFGQLIEDSLAPFAQELEALKAEDATQ